MRRESMNRTSSTVKAMINMRWMKPPNRKELASAISHVRSNVANTIHCAIAAERGTFTVNLAALT